MASISGLGSGIDIDAIVKATIDAEKAPKTSQLSRQETSSTAKFTAFGTLKSALNEFQTALKSLSQSSLYGKSTATSSSTTQVTATAANGAQAGKYQIEVDSLAAASRVTTAAVEKGFSSEEGSLRIGLGANDTDSVEVRIAQGQPLEQIRTTLNDALKDKGISVNIVNDSSGTARLVFSSSNAGAGKDIVISSDPGTNLSQLAADGTRAREGEGAGRLQQATDAVFKVDGITMRSAGNKAVDVVPGVTLDLQAITEKNKPVTITVGSDVAGVTSNVKKFVESYNKLIDTANGLTSVTTVEGSTPLTGDLVGDSTVRALLNQVRSELGSLSGGAGTVRNLSSLGITTEKDGKLAITNAKLTSSLQNNFAAVGEFFSGEKGLMTRLNNRLDVYVQTDGILDQRMKGQRAILDDVKVQREALDRRVSSLQTRLYAQYNAMDSLVGQLTSTSAWMTSAFESLPGFVKKS